jgi:hypothetical protein
MCQRVDARDVLDADATTSRAFTGRIVGVYRRSGPNSWDDYILVDEDGGPLDVFPETPIQVEPHGALFRMRRRGEVVLVAWIPEEPVSDGELHTRFLKSCVRDTDPTPAGNLGAWLHAELKRKPEPHD